VIAFYSPQAEWSQASRILASTTQLHSQMGLGIWKLKYLENEDDDNAKLFVTMLEDWSKRYIDIQTVSGVTSKATGPEVDAVAAVENRAVVITVKGEARSRSPLPSVLTCQTSARVTTL
jgi:hypothetical protein